MVTKRTLEIVQTLQIPSFGILFLSVLTCACYYVATHPILDKRLQGEIKTVLGDNDVNQGNIKELVYVRKLRIYNA